MNEGAKKLLARVSLVLFGLLLLLVAEGLLRLVWTPSPLTEENLTAVAIDPFALEGKTAQLKKSYRAAFRSQSFAVPKESGTFRIFCLGGSTTLGYPYAADVAWPAGLERRLRQLFPQRRTEVINLGGTSYGSSRTLALLRGVLKYQPDLIVVATGDAEFVEDSFRVAIESRRPAAGILQKLYLSRALIAMLPKPQRVVTIDADDQAAAGFLFAPAPAGTVYRVDPIRRREVNARFRKNMGQIIQLADHENIPLLLGTLPANIVDWPPDPDSRLPRDPKKRRTWQDLVAVGDEKKQAGQFAAALAEYEMAAGIWSENASFSFDFGQLLRANGEEQRAKEELLKAVALDPAPVRATRFVNRTIRELARAPVLLADSVHAFEALAADQLVGEDLILDYAHPTPRGHVEIAAVVLDTMTRLGTQWQVDAGTAARVHAVELNRAETAASEVSSDLNFVLGQIFERKGLSAQAESMYRQALAQNAEGPFARLNLARILAARGALIEALEQANRVVSAYPELTETYALLGYIYENLGTPIDAIDWYRKALTAGEQSPGLFLSLGRLLLAERQPDQAMVVFSEGLKNFPANCQVASWLGRAAESSPSRQDEAVQIYRAQLLADPDCQLAAENLGILLMNQQRWQEAKVVFKKALSGRRPLARHYLNLGYVYLEGLRDQAAARRYFIRYQQLEPTDLSVVPPAFRKSRQPLEGAQ